MQFSKTRQFLPNRLQIRSTMKPKKSPQDQPSTFQIFQSRLDNTINLDHPLVHLAALMQWERFDEAYAAFYCQDNGAPGLPPRLMVGLYYLKYTFNLSDEELIKRWLENPYWQYFCGETHFQTDFPCDATSLGIWRRRIGKGKDRIRYEFGQQAAVVKTNSGNWIVNVEDLPDNPYAGHTLARSIAGAEKITKVTVKEAD